MTAVPSGFARVPSGWERCHSNPDGRKPAEILAPSGCQGAPGFQAEIFCTRAHMRAPARTPVRKVTTSLTYPDTLTFISIQQP
jgi:hypothetical protein